MNVHILDLIEIKEIKQKLAEYGYKTLRTRKEINMTKEALYKEMNLDEKLKSGHLTEEDLKMLEQQAYVSGRNQAIKEMDCFRFGLE
ncbi:MULTISPECIES: hypothetical protein [Lactobacillus]|uniref:Uncharacterized protein n=1 Tax=Lactobacillus johnsonii TaxID=33959 RepID=A0A9X4X985_LACJH|nr:MULTISPECIES: hypothetical protein [Lactobacillus]MTE03631.1 hypothetical protein [Lactobacillus johnsonii]